MTGARYPQNPFDTFPRNFLVDGEVANLLRTCYGVKGKGKVKEVYGC